MSVFEVYTEVARLLLREMIMMIMIIIWIVNVLRKCILEFITNSLMNNKLYSWHVCCFLRRRFACKKKYFSF